MMLTSTEESNLSHLQKDIQLTRIQRLKGNLKLLMTLSEANDPITLRLHPVRAEIAIGLGPDYAHSSVLNR